MKKRLDAIEVELKIKMTPEESARAKALTKRIDEARKRCGIKRRDQGTDVDPGGGLFDRLKAARLNRLKSNKHESSEKPN